MWPEDLRLRPCSNHWTSNDMLCYVTTRYYRAPELMLTWQTYGFAVDIWSTACVFAEMLDGKVLFPGNNDISQLSLIAALVKGDGEMKGSTWSNVRRALKAVLSDPLVRHSQFPLGLSYVSAYVERRVVAITREILRSKPRR